MSSWTPPGNDFTFERESASHMSLFILSTCRYWHNPNRGSNEPLEAHTITAHPKIPPQKISVIYVGAPCQEASSDGDRRHWARAFYVFGYTHSYPAGG